MACEKTQALDILWKMENLPLYEPNFETIEVLSPMNDEKSGLYLAKGLFWGMPWSGKFTFEKKVDGFYSEMLSLPLGMRISGGFIVEALSDTSTKITHYDTYEIPWFLRVIATALKDYIDTSMKGELVALEELIEFNL